MKRFISPFLGIVSMVAISVPALHADRILNPESLGTYHAPRIAARVWLKAAALCAGISLICARRVPNVHLATALGTVACTCSAVHAWYHTWNERHVRNALKAYTKKYAALDERDPLGSARLAVKDGTVTMTWMQWILNHELYSMKSIAPLHVLMYCMNRDLADLDAMTSYVLTYDVDDALLIEVIALRKKIHAIRTEILKSKTYVDESKAIAEERARREELALKRESNALKREKAARTRV